MNVRFQPVQVMAGDSTLSERADTVASTGNNVVGPTWKARKTGAGWQSQTRNENPAARSLIPACGIVSRLEFKIQQIYGTRFD